MENTAKIVPITSDLTTEVFTDAFRRHVGLHKPFSRQQIADATDMDISLIHAFMDGKNAPPLWRFLRIAAVLGPEFVDDVLRLAGLGGVERLGPQGACVLRMTAQAAALVAEMSAHLADDGRIDAAELAESIPTIQLLHEQTGEILAAQQRRAAHLRVAK